MLGSNKELVFGVLLQNVLHPKNNNRVEAIKSGSYNELKTPEEAQEFIKGQLQVNL